MAEPWLATPLDLPVRGKDSGLVPSVSMEFPVLIRWGMLCQLEQRSISMG